MSTTIIHSKSGAKATVYTFGATVTSFTNSIGRELLFLSTDAKLDGSKAIRGGIPLVFPQFGAQPDTTMVQHGFARNTMWTLEDDKSFDTDESAGITLSLALNNVKTSARGSAGEWAASSTSEQELDCLLTMEIKISASSLTTTLTITNTGLTSFDFQTLFHTYYHVDQHDALNSKKCNVVGLEGYICEDKISGETYTTDATPIGIDSNVDRIYTPPSSDDGKRNVLDITIMTGGDTSASLKAFGTVDGKEVPTSCVVWNPHKKKAEEMGDFNNDGYHDMICCEPGLLSNIPKLEGGGKECVFTQIMTTI